MKSPAFIAIVLVAIAIIIFAVRLLLLQNQISTEAIPVPTQDESGFVDITKQAVESNSDLQEGIRLIQDGRFADARVFLQKAVETETNPDTKSVADLTLASSYLRDNQAELAAQNLFRVASEPSYPSSTRAFALTTIVQQYNATKDISLLKVFGDTEEFNTSYLLQGAHRQIVAIYPMGLSVAYLARIDMDRFADKAEVTYNEAIQKIDADIAFQNKGQESNHLVPNIMIAKANLMAKAEGLGFASRKDVVTAYKEAITTAKEKIQTTTSQFAMLQYMNYLGKDVEENKVLIDEALTILEAEKLTEMVVNHLAREEVVYEWPGIIAIARVNQAYVTFFSQYVPVPQQ